MYLSCLRDGQKVTARSHEKQVSVIQYCRLKMWPIYSKLINVAGYPGMKNLLLNCFLSLCLLPLVISSTTEINDENYISEKVFGASDSKKTDDFISELPDNLLIHLMRQFPTVPFKLWAVNSFFKEFVERNSPNQQVLAENLELNGFKTLPLHGDLRVFENVKFPKDSTGKVTSLVFVFMMSSRVLSRSSILDAVLGIVYEEAALLAQNAPAEFENFLKLSRFEIVADPISVFKHFAKKENIYGLIEFMAACPGLFWNSSCIEKFHNEGLLSQVIELVARHVTEKPQIVNLLFSRSKIQRMKLLMLICSELPIESVKEFLQTDCKLEAEVYVHFILSSSDYPIYSSIRNHEQYESRLSEIILCANQLFQSSEEAAPLLNCFKEIHMLSYNLDEWNNPFPEAPIFLNFAFSALFRRGQFDEALKHLPRQVSIPTFKHIAVNEEFSKRLVKENPKWIKDRIYFERLPEEYQSLHFVMADENVDTVDGLTEGSDRLATIRQIYMHCSLESIEKMIERLPHKKIGDYFMCLCEQEMDLPRFIQILALFARSPNAKSEYIYFHACLNVNSFFYLLGQGRVDLLSFILTNPFGIK